ncbi:MAG TPA: GspMb/PilO family protein [Gemmatimonadaceae bacterium]|jgi:hypothetical protein
MGVGAVALILLAGRGGPRLWAWTVESRQAAVALRTQERRTLSDLRTLRRTHDSADARRYALGDAFPSLLRGLTTAAITASLAELVSEEAEIAGVRLGTVDVRADTTRRTGAYLRVTAHADLTGDVRGVSALIAGLEGNQRRLAIRHLSITQSAVAAGPQQMEALHATIVVEGLGRRPVHVEPSGGR